MKIDGLEEQDEGSTVQGNRCLWKGNLCKKNWYGNKQIRFFELYSDGEIKYYKDEKEYKGTITIGPSSKIIKEGKSTLLIDCIVKKKQYTIMQPDSTQISFRDEKAKGYSFMIDDWFVEINKVRDELVRRGSIKANGLS